MDKEASGILFTLLIDVCLFIILVILSIFYRKFRSKDLPHESIKKPYLNESSTPLLSLVSAVYYTTNAELSDKLSYLAYMYMELHTLALITLITMTVAGMEILIPVYVSGDLAEEKNMDQLSMANVITDENNMIAPIVILFLFSALLYVMAFIYHKRCKREELDVIYRIANRSVFIYHHDLWAA